MIPPFPWHRPKFRAGPGDRVVLLHGLWRSVWAMEGLAAALNNTGFETLNIPYPSFRQSLDEIVTGVIAEIEPTEKRTHFVTHSMGGIVLRCLAHRAPGLVTGKIVMLAPPNQGSEIIDWLEDSFLGRGIFGPGGMSLTTEHVRAKVPGFDDSHEVTVVMGKKGRLPLFNFLLGNEHDGIVTVSGGKVVGMTNLETIDADHTFIMNHKDAHRAVLRSLVVVEPKENQKADPNAPE